MAYLSLEKETCFFGDGVFPLPSLPGTEIYPLCVLRHGHMELRLQPSC